MPRLRVARSPLMNDAKPVTQDRKRCENRTGTAIARALVALGTLAGLAACSETPTQGPRTSVAQEAATYRAHAKHYYAPPGPASDPWGPYIEEASSRFDVPDIWIRAIMMRESGGREFDRNGNFTTSTPGAMGLMQLMPPTYDDMRNQLGLGDDPYDPHDSILAGTAYIRQMYEIYGSPGFLAAYNDGPGNLNAYLRRGRPLPRETRQYVAAVGRQIAGTSPNNRSQADILVAQHDPNAASPVMVAQNTAESNAIRSAWRQRSTPASRQVDEAEPVQVAEASAPVASNASEASSISAAWASRGITAAPVQLASARPTQADTAPARYIAEAQPIPFGRTLPAQPVSSRATAPVPSPASGTGLHFISSAMAEPLPTAHRLGTSQSGGEWAIQVGAYNSATQAQSAVGEAHSRAGVQLASARTAVSSVASPRGHLYRARLTGLSHDEAVAACRRIAGRSTPCVVVSPRGF